MLTVKKRIIKFGVKLLKKTEILSAVACRLVQITGKHPSPIHPKHLVKVRPSWYLRHLKKNDTVLDVGCNNGQHTVKIAQAVRQVEGFDKDSRMLDLAQQEVSRLGISNINLRQADAQKILPYRNDYFNAVIFLDVFEHLARRSLVLKEIHRVLKTKGKLLISVPKSDTEWKKLQKSLGLFFFSDPDHKIEFTTSQIQALLRKHGFKVKSVSPVTLDTPLAGLIDFGGGLSLNLYAALSRWRRQEALKQPENSIGLEIVCEKI